MPKAYFKSVLLSFRHACETNKRIKQHKSNRYSVKHTANLKKAFCIHKFRDNSPKFNNTKNRRATVNG